MPDGTYAQIEHASVDTPKETLGVWTCPTGNASGALVGMKKKAQEWVDRAKEGHLKRRDIWFLVDNQFWPKVGYGLCSNTATFETLTTCLDKQYFELLPLGGIIRTAKKGLGQTSRGFYGAGCPHVGVECLVAQTNKLLMHYGTASGLGMKMKVSLNLMLLELGISSQPFRESYKKYKKWVTASGMKSLWEKCDLLNVLV